MQHGCNVLCINWCCFLVCPLEVSLSVTRSRKSSESTCSTAADREKRSTEAKTRKENASDTITNLTSSCAAKTRQNGGRATARNEKKEGRRRDTIMAITTALIMETNWGRRTGTTWVVGKNASETR